MLRETECYEVGEKAGEEGRRVCLRFRRPQFDHAVRTATRKVSPRRLPAAVFYIDGDGFNVMGARRWPKFEIRWLPGAPSQRITRSSRIDGARRLKSRAHPHGNRRPNGSGKSTLTRSIARHLNPLNPPAAAMAAGREVLKQRRTISIGTFAVETTLSSRGRVDLMRKAKSRRYEIHLLFIGLDSPERWITRIRNRAALGGRSFRMPT